MLPKRLIPHIEKALKIKLYESQVQFLLCDMPIRGNRRVGRTTAHCIKLALSDGESLDMNKPEMFSDYGDGSVRYAREFYRREFMKIRTMLKEYGFSVRDIKIRRK